MSDLQHPSISPLLSYLRDLQFTKKENETCLQQGRPSMAKA